MPAHAQRMSSLLASDKEVAALNMEFMFATLEVSKLSGWLNDDANCRVERRAYDAGEVHLGGGRAWGSSGASGAQGGPDYKGWGQRVRAERTRNIWFMFVTLEVTQLEMSALKFCKL